MIFCHVQSKLEVNRHFFHLPIKLLQKLQYLRQNKAFIFKLKQMVVI
jgi:hypothetical protein